MSTVRALVGTRKGAFLLTADGARRAEGFRAHLHGHLGGRRLSERRRRRDAVAAGAEPFLIVGAMAGG